MRPLILHASALSDAEYDFYTSSLNDIADETSHNHQAASSDDVHYERKSVGVREFRAWLRGRYSHLPASTIDTILKFFSPSLGQGDVLTGGQFFAALRLVVHVDNGKQVDRSLAFVQAVPVSKITQNGTNVPAPAAPPPPPSRRHHDGASKSVSLFLTPTVNEISPSSSVTVNNPFTALSTPDANHGASPSIPQAPPQHPMLRVDPTKTTTHSSYNPFTKPSPTQKHDDPTSNKSPPLPPRKPPPPPVPPQQTRHAAPPIPAKRSTSPVRQATATTPLLTPYGAATHSGGHLPPPTTALKPVSHVTSTLIKQSLHASKVAQSLKKAEEQLEKERIMQVLKSSSSGGSAARNRSLSPAKAFAPSGPLGNTVAVSSSSSSHSGSDDHGRTAAPPLPKRREQTQHRRTSRLDTSPPLSTSSYEQVALAGVAYRREPSIGANSKSCLANDDAGPPSSPGPSERGRSHSHPTRSSERGSSISSFQHETTGNGGSNTSSPSRTCVGLPAIPPPTHPDRREQDKSRRYSSVSVHSGKPSAGRLNAPGQAQAIDTRTFDSVYGSLVSPVIAEDDSPRTPSTNAPSLYATPPSEISHLPHVQTTNLPSTLSTASLDSPTPTMADSSPTARVFRSRSLHQSSTPPPVPPPLRKKRPESVQVLGGSPSAPHGFGNGGSLFHELVHKFEGNSVTSTDNDHMDGEGTKKLSRHLSLSSPGGISPSSRYGSSRTFGTVNDSSNEDSSSSTTRRSSVSATSAPASMFLSHPPSEEPLSLASLQRTFSSLQPKLDKVRYKAEAGISRRGFIQGNGVDSGVNRGGEREREGLVRHITWKSGSESSTSVDEESGKGVEREWRDSRMAEGWTPL